MKTTFKKAYEAPVTEVFQLSTRSACLQQASPRDGEGMLGGYGNAFEI